MAEGLYNAAVVGDLAKVEEMVTLGVAVDARCGEDRRTPLMAASQHGHNSVVVYLLRHEADPNARDADGWTALMEAACYSNVKVVVSLLQAGARVGEGNRQGYTALHMAASIDNLPTVTALLTYGANPWAQDGIKRFGHPAVAAIIKKSI